MRRGQAAIEYLIILAVVVIIALIVIGAIGGFPGRTRGISERESAAYWAAADIGITRYFVSAFSENWFVIKNNRLFTVNITSITIGGEVFSTPFTLAPGSSTSISPYTPVCTVEETYSWNTVITYKDATYGNTYTFTGEKPLVGTCQHSPNE
ncbi:MAG: class III signal peptide-containing protein [Candidatus Micrarchaeota archaeon]|nr:class III signal peptide-containing protein [Candidatus Micrarchaeota archaeon]